MRLIHLRKDNMDLKLIVCAYAAEANTQPRLNLTADNCIISSVNALIFRAMSNIRLTCKSLAYSLTDSPRHFGKHRIGLP